MKRKCVIKFSKILICIGPFFFSRMSVLSATGLLSSDASQSEDMSIQSSSPHLLILSMGSRAADGGTALSGLRRAVVVDPSSPAVASSNCSSSSERSSGIAGWRLKRAAEERVSTGMIAASNTEGAKGKGEQRECLQNGGLDVEKRIGAQRKKKKRNTHDQHGERQGSVVTKC